MDMPSDFASKKKKPKSRSRILLWIIPLIVAIGLVSYYLSGSSNKDPAPKPVLATENPNIQEEEQTFIEPPSSEYEFYKTLSEEEAEVIERQEIQPPPVQQEYFLLVEYFVSYDKALARSKELNTLKISPIKIEPFGRDIKFRLRIGPYLSRSKMNAARDILVHHEIPHRVIARQK